MHEAESDSEETHLLYLPLGSSPLLLFNLYVPAICEVLTHKVSAAGLSSV